MTVFNNATHKALFLTTDRMGSAERIAFSDVIVTALMESGLFDGKFEIGLVAPVDTNMVWIDPTSDPAAVLIHDGTGWVLDIVVSTTTSCFILLVSASMQICCALSPVRICHIDSSINFTADIVA